MYNFKSFFNEFGSNSCIHRIYQNSQKQAKTSTNNSKRLRADIIAYNYPAEFGDKMTKSRTK